MRIIQVLNEAGLLLLKGLGITIIIAIISLAFATIIGLITCLFSLSKNKFLNIISKIYITIIRGTPLIVQTFFLYYGIPSLYRYLFQSRLAFNIYVASVVILMLNAGAYISEIFRGGINSIDKGQIEAAEALGLTKFKIYKRVVVPQAIKISLPSLVNQFIITLKDTSIIAMIALPEVVYWAQIYIGQTSLSFETWIIVGILYLVIVIILTYLQKFIERKLKDD